MRIMDGQFVAFMGDSITEHLVAVSACMEMPTDGLPPVGTRVYVDRHENRGGLQFSLTTFTWPILSAEYAILMLGLGATARGRC